MDGRSRHFFWNAPIYFNNSNDKNEFERNIILIKLISEHNISFIVRIWSKNLIFSKSKSEIWAYFMKNWTKIRFLFKFPGGEYGSEISNFEAIF